MKIINAALLCVLLFSCNKDEEQLPSITTPVYTPPSEVEINIVSSTDTLGYTVLENFFSGIWHHSMLASIDGNVVMVGYGRAGFRQSKMVAIKTDALGELVYQRTIFDDYYGGALGVCEDDFGNIYVVGYLYIDELQQDRMIGIAKLDAEGNISWEKIHHQLEGSMSASYIALLPDGEILVSGSHDSNLILLKMTSEGEELLFEKSDAPDYNLPNGMLLLGDGRILVTSSYEEEMHLSWYDQELQLLKQESYGPRITRGSSVIQLNDGNLLSIGSFIYTSNGTNNIDAQAVQLIKLSVDGELIWESKVGNLDYLNNGLSIRENTDGSFVLTGYTINDHMLIYVDAQGTELNARYYLDNKTYRGQNIIKGLDGRNMITGGYQGGTFFLNVDNYGAF